MKKIIFDITHYNRKSWFWRVTKEIINWFIKKYSNDFKIILVWNNVWFEEILWLKVYNFKWSYILFKLFQLKNFLKKNKWDIFFSFDNIFFGKVNWHKYITIIHDIWQEKWYKKNWILYYIKKKNFYFPFFHGLNFTLKNLKKSNKIIVPSEYTKEDLITFYWLKNNDKEKIKIIKWWVDHFWNINIDTKNDKEIQILFPFPVLTDDKLNQIIDLVNKLQDFKILFLWVKWVIKQKIIGWVKTNLNIIFNEKYLNDNELIWYFQWKNICIYISDNDWFWFLPLECQYFWNPVLATYWTSIPNILWDSVEYIKENDDINKILEKIKKLKNNYEDYSKKSLNNSKKYKWENTVNEIYNLINKI